MIKALGVIFLLLIFVSWGSQPKLWVCVSDTGKHNVILIVRAVDQYEAYDQFDDFVKNRKKQRQIKTSTSSSMGTYFILPMEELIYVDKNKKPTDEEIK